ncbi:hypothetical protein BD770DRAFT_416449 [Pilaira anomala]|nr:hypothetical protein BD770DRAFT_416449 [Pilaira anomala]
MVITAFYSGQFKENTKHSIEDTLKILECGISSSRKEAAHSNDASLSKFLKLNVYGVHVIKSQVTFSEISLDDETHWKCIELRNAKLPTAWSDRVNLVQYMELLATLYVCLLLYLNQLYNNNIISSAGCLSRKPKDPKAAY